MISSIRGSVLSAGLDNVVVEVGGVGLLVHTTPAHAASARVGTEATFFTTLVVREDSLTLYGFGDDSERKLFELVQTVSGVGPRLALAMLAVHAPDALRGAIAGGDVPTLMKVPGIGKKGAERIVLELKDKVGALTGGGSSSLPQPQVPAADETQQQVVDALVGLGWSTKQAQDAVAKVTKADDAPTDVSQLLRVTLRSLGR
ncbi:Holliday junction branch migration protein RuvA [Yimella sp. RIT 621]|uniref:Holliday junction branch migration protein RuvA n=1 Tax=Yimella sp. RIT 621 TaxID=2510323 RepID=UPI00101BF0A1|nr:Holliday junction branch migration protein RuvA [Yimella sp. RIT 621]RYG78844.1 Holliday junction branch migration protein RuvA [Yimella sp. RIT 621]